MACFRIAANAKTGFKSYSRTDADKSLAKMLMRLKRLGDMGIAG